ncbi:hypothetical protein [Asticcacaulis machinosus]|uniref:Uncharacterized protein n=1 Tax=Asticcacaulis machinosus TaxID=2984211 RepID=A0ABT5HMA0_9CAUL|nr:hypothetical protein [Asticcacaulis machinosus]MDC7676719.1 hypothetical protein [Asticcacaulis machinosus]
MSRMFKSIIVAGLIAGAALPAQAEEPTRVTGYQTVMIGQARVTALYKGFVTGSAHQAEVAHAYRRLISDQKTAPVPALPEIAAFVVDAGGKITLICVDGVEPTPAVRGYLMSSLVAAGYSPEDIDEIRAADADLSL